MFEVQSKQANVLINTFYLFLSMRSKTEYLTLNTPTRRAFVNITPSVRKIVEESGIREGLCLVVLCILRLVFL